MCGCGEDRQAAHTLHASCNRHIESLRRRQRATSNGNGRCDGAVRRLSTDRCKLFSELLIARTTILQLNKLQLDASAAISYEAFPPSCDCYYAQLDTLLSENVQQPALRRYGRRVINAAYNHLFEQLRCNSNDTTKIINAFQRNAMRTSGVRTDGKLFVQRQ